MLEGAGVMFEEMGYMLDRLKKKNYEDRMVLFRKKFRPVVLEMLELIRQAPDAKEAAQDVADQFLEIGCQKCKKWGKLRKSVKVDMGMYMIYFLFPSILLEEDEYGKQLCDAVRDNWRSRSENSVYEYGTYEEIYEGFKERLLGISWGGKN